MAASSILWISALIDSLLHAISGAGLNPRLALKGLHLYKVRGVGVVAVRGGTDDFYHAIPGREGDVDAFVRSCLKEGTVFVDVGANIGYYTLIASRLVGPQGRVHSIEPVPSTAAILETNVRLNSRPNVSVHKVAAWSSRGALILRIPGSWYGLASASRNGRGVPVDSITLDELLESEDSIDCMKIDVEGAELEVLRGARDVLKRTKCLVIEISHSASEVLKILQGAKFKCRKARFTTYVLCERPETSSSREGQ